MNGFILLLPFLFIRFGLLSKLNNQAIHRAAHFPSMKGNEIPAYWIYQSSNVLLFVYLVFLNVVFQNTIFCIAGIVLYVISLLLCTITMINFSHPSTVGINTNGIYKYSRNPMYVSYFLYFVACSLLTNSYILGVITIIFQLSAHWIILAEERWCMETFGLAYKEYMRKVRRYI